MTEPDVPHISALRLARYRVQLHVLDAWYFWGRSARFTLAWLAVAVALWLLDPGWAIDSKAAVETTLMLVSAFVVGMFVLLLTVVIGVAQQAANLYSARAIMVLASDASFLLVLTQSIVVAIATLLVGTSLGDGDPSRTSNAATTALTAASIVLLARSAKVMPLLLMGFGSPRAFTQRALNGVRRDLNKGRLNHVVYRLPMFGEMMVSGITRNDGIATSCAAEAMVDFYNEYLGASEDDANVRIHRLDDGAKDEHWAARAAGRSLCRAAESAWRLRADSTQIDTVGGTFRALIDASLKHGRTEETTILIEWLLSAGTLLVPTTDEVGLVIMWDAPYVILAQVEKDAETAGNDAVASHALASWAVAMDWLTVVSPEVAERIFAQTALQLGETPPVLQASGVVYADDWTQHWQRRAHRNPQDMLDAVHALRTSSDFFPTPGP